MPTFRMRGKRQGCDRSRRGARRLRSPWLRRGGPCAVEHAVGLEPLELRVLLSAAMHGGTLFITDTPGDDAIEVMAGDQDGQVIVRGVDGVDDDTLFDRVYYIRVRCGDGNDTVRIAEGLRDPRGRFIGATLQGGEGDDTLTGGDGRDVILGGEGNDTLIGGDGNDVILGRGGDDTLIGEGGQDVLLGGDGDDTMYGGYSGAIGDPLLDAIHDPFGIILPPNGWLQVGDPTELDFGVHDADQPVVTNHAIGPFIVHTDSTSADTEPDGRDVVIGGRGRDKLSGSAGNDVLVGGPDRDAIWGGAGDDLILGGDGDDVLRGGDGNDRVFGQDGSDALLGEDGDDLMTGGDEDDTLWAGDGDDRVFGQDGNDTLYGEQGNDLLVGGDGDDVLLGGLGPRGFDDHLLDFGPLADTGDDLLVGGNGNDYLVGGRGSDDMRGGRGNDWLNADESDTLVHPGPGRGDVVSPSPQDDPGVLPGSEDVVAAAAADVAARSDVRRQHITLVSVEEAVWEMTRWISDDPFHGHKETYPVPGYRILLRVGDQILDYHVLLDGRPISPIHTYKGPLN